MNESEPEAPQSRSLQDGVGDERFSIDLQCLQDDVRSFIHTLKDMEREYNDELLNMAEDDEAVSSTIGFGGITSKMIGLSDQIEELKSFLLRRYGRNYFFALVGTAGVGKTALAEAVFEDPEILIHFERRAWVTVGRKPQIDEVSRGIRAQMYGVAEEEERLDCKNCLIVLDDVWEREILDSLVSSLPKINNGLIQILVTTRDNSVIQAKLWSYSILVWFLNEEESKELLCEKVFGEEIFPPQLDKAATKIAKKCEGLPLMILTVADILSKSQNRDPQFWEDVAEERNSVFRDAYNEITKVLFPSYDYLPQYLKTPFLFMGVFPPEYDTPPSKIIHMLAAEGWFLDTNKNQSLEASVWECLYELCMVKNLVLFNIKSIYHFMMSNSSPVMKTCRLHSSWRQVCRGEARKSKFYQVLSKLVHSLQEGVKGQRCLCLENNMLFGIKEFCNSMRSNCASSTRSLLFFRPYHQYPIPIHVGFSLPRELDALKLPFYTFPTEILTLVQLKYLALTCNEELPTTISKLFNLQVLIVHPHMSIRCCRAPSYVPIQIWDMKELEHIDILGKNLVAPYHVSSLEKLSTLVCVNASICTIFKLSRRIPNIKKLGVQIELTPYDDKNDLLSCFVCFSRIGNLKILKCSIINHVVKSEDVVPTTPSSLMLPRGLKKLHLSGMGFPWEYMDVIGSLPFLHVLKLRSYAFRGPKWEAQGGTFQSLEFLLVEDTDLVCYLSMKHCYKLQEIYWPSHSMLGKIELVDCNPLALAWAKEFQPNRGILLDVTISSSFDKKPMTIKLQRY